MPNPLAFGTREWAPGGNVNFCEGCTHNCRYCYARRIADTRFHRLTHPWEDMVVCPTKVTRQYRLRPKGAIMFPSSHDLTPAILPETLTVLHRLLQVGNQVILVSKPHLEVIQAILNLLETHSYPGSIVFRFTIGSTNNSTLRYWEPGAPSFEERIACLQAVFLHHYPTSVSIEPFLDPTPDAVIQAVSPYVTESIWIGTMSQHSCIPMSAEWQTALCTAYSPDVLHAIWQQWRETPPIHWKCSIGKFIPAWATTPQHP